MALVHCIKNKFISSVIGTIGIYMSLAFLLTFPNFSVYITSYIHLNQDFVNMHWGIFIGVIFGLASSFSRPLGGYLENIIGFNITILLGIGINACANTGFIFQQNIWISYSLVIVMGTNKIFG